MPCFLGKIKDVSQGIAVFSELGLCNTKTIFMFPKTVEAKNAGK